MVVVVVVMVRVMVGVTVGVMELDQNDNKLRKLRWLFLNSRTSRRRGLECFLLLEIPLEPCYMRLVRLAWCMTGKWRWWWWCVCA